MPQARWGAISPSGSAAAQPNTNDVPGIAIDMTKKIGNMPMIEIVACKFLSLGGERTSRRPVSSRSCVVETSSNSTSEFPIR